MKTIIHLKDLTPDPKNARAHNPRNVGMIERALGEVGAARSIVVDEDGVVLAGNATIEAAAQAGIERVQVVDADGETLIAVRRSGLTGEQKAMLALYDNRAAETAAWNTERLAELRAAFPERMKHLFSEQEFARLGVNGGPLLEDPGPQLDRAEELRAKWGVESGQLWRLGDHRLLCGDSTRREDVERVMAGEQAEMVWTDPPYGVAIGDKNKYLNAIAPSNRVEENIENDTLSDPELVAMLSAAFDNGIAVCTAGAAWYVAAPPGPLHVLFGSVLKDRGIWRQTIQWVKNNATFAPLGVDYHWRAEPIFYGWLPNAGHRYYGGRQQDTVWNIDRPLKSPEHPTMKPIELIARAIENSSRMGEVVMDLFVGSGTTLMACEHLDRRARCIEISPTYCAVTLQRWADMTGRTPELIGSA